MGEQFCDYPECDEVSIGTCDECDTQFCWDHGDVGRDREVAGVGVAYPSVCWQCGGFNADEVA